MDSGKNAKLGGQTLFSMCFQKVCYKSHVNHLPVLDQCDTEDELMFRVLQTKSRIPGGNVFKNVILHELLQSDLTCILRAKAYLKPRNILERFLMKL